MILGAQLYTLRDFTKTPNELSDTLKRVADIGYKTVQISSTCEYNPDWLNQRLNENELKCVLTHFNPDKIKDSPAETVEFHNKFGCKNIGIGAVPGGLKNDRDYDRFLSEFLPAAKEIYALGSKFMFHNHFYEFVKSNNGKLFIERMIKDFSADELGFILDTYWVQYSGADPAWWIRNLAGRVECVHLKDMAYTNTHIMTPVGYGNMNFNSIIKACEDSKTKYLLVEQDYCYDENPFECMTKSYNYLKSLGLE